MTEDFALTLKEEQRNTAMKTLEECNEITTRYGLSLNETQQMSLVDRRYQSLAERGRMEFDNSLLKNIILAFCDSPFIDQDNFEETIAEVTDAFYYFKNESQERIGDDDLIAMMKEAFDGVCQGSLDYLCGTSLEDLAKNTRLGEVFYKTEE